MQCSRTVVLRRVEQAFRQVFWLSTSPFHTGSITGTFPPRSREVQPKGHCQSDETTAWVPLYLPSFPDPFPVERDKELMRTATGSSGTGEVQMSCRCSHVYATTGKLSLGHLESWRHKPIMLGAEKGSVHGQKDYPDKGNSSLSAQLRKVGDHGERSTVRRLLC
jgi:hypothetical protein